MIPIGYMAKKIALKPHWLKNNQVEDIYSVSDCISHDFDDYINYWQHNGYWLFNSPEIIQKLAEENNIQLDGLQFFYYKAYEYQYYHDSSEWKTYEPEHAFETNIKVPRHKTLEGYDIVSFSLQNKPECSYLSCNYMAQTIQVNQHCLLKTLEYAKNLLNDKVFDDCELGPSRILAVYSIPNP